VLGVQLSLLAGGSFSGTQIGDSPVTRVSQISPQEPHSIDIEEVQEDAQQELQYLLSEHSAQEEDQTESRSSLPDPEPPEIMAIVNGAVIPTPLLTTAVGYEPPITVLIAEPEITAEVSLSNPSAPNQILSASNPPPAEEGDEAISFSLSSGLVPLPFNPFSHLQQRRQTALELGAGLDLLLGEETGPTSVPNLPKKKKKKRKQVCVCVRLFLLCYIPVVSLH
jgi:hypothetical protein